MERFLTSNRMRSVIIASVLIASSLSFVSFEEVLAIPPDFVEGNYIFGNIIGVVEENENPIWVVSGNWKTNLGNQTQNLNGSNIEASFEMIKIDGTERHTHTMTNFELEEADQSANSLLFNGTSTISMKDGTITEVPVSIKIMGNNLISILIDPNKVDNHFGTGQIYGITIQNTENR